MLLGHTWLNVSSLNASPASANLISNDDPGILTGVHRDQAALR